MSSAAWISLAALGVTVLVNAAASIWWAATVNAKVSALQDGAKTHGDLRDIVIEMRTEMRGFQASIRELAEGLREARGSRRASGN